MSSLCDFVPKGYQTPCRVAQAAYPYVSSMARSAYSKWSTKGRGRKRKLAPRRLFPNKRVFNNATKTVQNRPLESTLVSTRSGQLYGPRFKKRRFKRRSVPIPLRIKKYVKAMVNKPEAYNTWRDNWSTHSTSDKNEQTWKQFDFMSRGELQGLGQNAEYISDSAGVLQPITINQQDNATVNFRTRFVSGYYKVICRNNATTPLDVTGYHFICKDNTNDGPLGYLSDAISAKGMVNTIDDLRVGINDGKCADGWRRKWKIYKKLKYRVNPGDEVTFQLNRNKPFWFETDTESVSDSYLKGISQCLVLQHRGIIEHDTVLTTNVGISESTLDVVQFKQIKFVPFSDKLAYTRLIEGTNELATVNTGAFQQADVEESKYDL